MILFIYIKKYIKIYQNITLINKIAFNNHFLGTDSSEGESGLPWQRLLNMCLLYKTNIWQNSKLRNVFLLPFLIQYYIIN